MSTLTKEWLQQTIAELEEERDAIPGAVNEDAAMALAAMKLALAAQTAVPDYYVVVTSVGVWQSFCKTKAEAEFIVSKPFNPGYSIREIYTAPPAPVSVLDEKQSREYFERWCSVNIERNKWHPEYYAHYPATGQWGAWEACRAAMLKGGAGNHPSIPDGYALVPVEPTEGMIAAAMSSDDVLFDTEDDTMFRVQHAVIWKAMLAAAPQREVK